MQGCTMRKRSGMSDEANALLQSVLQLLGK